MTEFRRARGEAYNRLREEFDALRVEDKAVFLLESTFSALVNGIESFGRVVGEELDRMFRQADEAAAEAHDVDVDPGTPAPNVTPEDPASVGGAPPESDIPGPRTKRKNAEPEDGEGL